MTAIILVFVILGIGVIVAACASVYLIIKRREVDGVILDDALKESGLDAAPDLAGKEGTAFTPLKPFGVAVFDGANVEVVSDGVMIPAGAGVYVVSVRDGKVFVRPKK